MSCRWKARSADRPQPRLRSRGTIEPCRCARNALTSRAGPTPRARPPASVCSTSPPRRRGAARRTAPRTTAAWPTWAGCTGAWWSPPSRTSRARWRRRRRVARLGRGHRQRSRSGHARLGTGRGRPSGALRQPLVASQALRLAPAAASAAACRVRVEWVWWRAHVPEPRNATSPVSLARRHDHR